MPIVRIACRLVREHRMLFAVYVLLFSLLGAFAAGSLGSSATAAGYVSARPTIAVIDRDGSAVSQELASYLADTGEMVEVDDTVYALQKAAANNFANYVLIIPEGYGAELIDAARAGHDAPDLSCIVSYMSASGALVDQRVSAWTQELYALAAASDAPATELVQMVDAAQETGVAVESVPTDETGLPITYLVYCQFALYALFGGIAAIVGTGLFSLRQTEIRQRIGVSCVAQTHFDAQVVGAISLCGIVVWAINACVGLVLYRDALSTVPPLFVQLMLVILFALMLVGMAFGFLVWQLNVRHELIHAICNIAAMIVAFLGGTWIPLDNMSEAVTAVARFTPGYWAVSGMQELVRATSVSGELIASVLTDAGLVVLFAVTIAAAGLAVGRVQRAA